MIEQDALAGALDSARKLSLFYLNRLERNKIDPLLQVPVNGTKLNCMLWLCAHITWAEYGIVLKTMLDAPLPHDWMGLFPFGSSSEPQAEWPEMTMIKPAMAQVHVLTLSAIRGFEELDTVVTVDFMGWTDTRRAIIYHAIRHEANHAGHLGWLCKVHGIKTI